MKNAEPNSGVNVAPKNVGTQIGLSVLYQPSFCQMRNDGIIVTCSGSMSVLKRISSAIDRPGQCSRAKA